jgi:hypothetical protein
MNEQRTSPPWDNMIQGNITQGPTPMLEQGYIQPKS